MAAHAIVDIEALLAQVELLASQIDPETTPFKSKYEAIDILAGLDSRLTNQLENLSSESSKDVCKTLAIAKYKQGVLHFETEEISNAEQYLLAFLKLTTPFSSEYLQESNVTHILDANNHLCMIYFQREEYEKAEKHLLDAESLYEAYYASIPPDSKKSMKLEQKYTQTVFYFAQVYGMMEETEKSAKYCQRTLNRKFESGVYDPKELATFCLQIAPYYQSEERWYQASYIIAAAATIAKTVTSKQLKAELALFVAKFYHEYLESQRKRLAYMPPLTEDVIEFKGLALDSDFERPKLEPIASATQARAWAATACLWFQKSLSYFELDGFTTEHVSICLERDALLSLSAEFESDRKQRKAVMRQRLSYLEPLIQTLSPVHFFQLVQQLLFTCGEICESVVDLSGLPLTDGLSSIYAGKGNNININSSIDGANQSISSTMEERLAEELKMKKLNKSVVAGVQYYQKFLETLMGEGDKLPKTLEEGVVESFFRAHLSLAKLHQKFRSNNKHVLVIMTRKAASYYKLTHTLGRAYKPNILQREIAMCPELEQLLTLKADSIEASTLSKS